MSVTDVGCTEHGARCGAVGSCKGGEERPEGRHTTGAAPKEGQAETSLDGGGQRNRARVLLKTLRGAREVRSPVTASALVVAISAARTASRLCAPAASRASTAAPTAATCRRRSRSAPPIAAITSADSLDRSPSTTSSRCALFPPFVAQPFVAQPQNTGHHLHGGHMSAV